MSIQTFKRREDKFILTPEQLDALKNKLLGQMELDAFCRNGSYEILNIYFDNTENDVIRHSVSKPYFKEKLRLRSYGTPGGDDYPVFLELKRKTGGIVNKRRAAMTYGQAVKYLFSGEKPENPDYLTRQVLNETDYFIMRNKVLPAYFLSYKRTAMFGIKDSSFRITLDTDIIARRDNVVLTGGCYGHRLLPPDTWLMEIKFSGAIPMDFVKILSDLKIYSRRFSKIGTEYNLHRINKPSEKNEKPVRINAYTDPVLN